MHECHRYRNISHSSTHLVSTDCSLVGCKLNRTFQQFSRIQEGVGIFKNFWE